jgi:hypothetical protein
MGYEGSAVQSHCAWSAPESGHRGRVGLTGPSSRLRSCGVKLKPVLVISARLAPARSGPTRGSQTSPFTPNWQNLSTEALTTIRSDCRIDLAYSYHVDRGRPPQLRPAQFVWASTVRGKNSQYWSSLNQAHLMSNRRSPASRVSARATIRREHWLASIADAAQFAKDPAPSDAGDGQA